MTRIEQASTTFQNGFNCSQAIFTAFADQCGIEPDTACRVANGFGGGIARHGEVCGAVTGAVMVIGAVLGRDCTDLTKEKQEIVYAKTQKLFAEFGIRMGSVTCKVLLEGIDLRSDAGQNLFSEKEQSSKTCVPCVEAAAEILELLLKDYP